MSLTAKDVAEIIRILEESTFDSLTLEMNGVKLNLRRNSAAVRPVVDPALPWHRQLRRSRREQWQRPSLLPSPASLT